MLRLCLPRPRKGMKTACMCRMPCVRWLLFPPQAAEAAAQEARGPGPLSEVVRSRCVLRSRPPPWAPSSALSWLWRTLPDTRATAYSHARGIAELETCTRHCWNVSSSGIAPCPVEVLMAEFCLLRSCHCLRGCSRSLWTFPSEGTLGCKILSSLGPVAGSVLLCCDHELVVDGLLAFCRSHAVMQSPMGLAPCSF